MFSTIITIADNHFNTLFPIWRHFDRRVERFFVTADFPNPVFRGVSRISSGSWIVCRWPVVGGYDIRTLIKCKN